MNWQKLYNPIVISLLHSPLHRLLDGQTMTMTITGRKSGRSYTFPVSYVQDGANLLVISQKDRTWWKNLRNGAPVTVFLKGRRLQASGEAFVDMEMVAKILLVILQKAPAYQRLLHIQLDATGQPDNSEAFTRLAQEYVVVRIKEVAEQAA
jgi:deazaflavin-dependent oxidoreductase (nitroreductase family)